MEKIKQILHSNDDVIVDTTDIQEESLIRFMNALGYIGIRNGRGFVLVVEDRGTVSPNFISLVHAQMLHNGLHYKFKRNVVELIGLPFTFITSKYTLEDAKQAKLCVLTYLHKNKKLKMLMANKHQLKFTDKVKEDYGYVDPAKTLKVGTVLCTKQPQRLTNAVVLDLEDDKAVILSDFGNVFKLSRSEVLSTYEISEVWKEMIQYGGDPYPLSERVRKQVELLNNVIEKYNL